MREITPVARIHTDFPEKFGIPRQSTLVPELSGVITFEDKFKDMAAIRGIEDYSHLWLLWDFSETPWNGDSLTVHPPRLGGKVKKGVFASRSPYRPNGIGLSCVKLERVEVGENGEPVLYVSGADMMDGTPIFDIKPYMPYSDSIPDAKGGYGQEHKNDGIKVDFPEDLLNRLPEDKRTAALHILQQDPRSAFNKDPDYVYGLAFAGMDIRFTANDEVIKVLEVVEHEDDFQKIK